MASGRTTSTAGPSGSAVGRRSPVSAAEPPPVHRPGARWSRRRTGRRPATAVRCRTSPGRPWPDQPAVEHQGDGVGDLHRLGLVVGHEHRRDAGLACAGRATRRAHLAPAAPASSWENGSSSSSTRGSSTSARANATRCSCPPESSPTRRRAKCGQLDPVQHRGRPASRMCRAVEPAHPQARTRRCCSTFRCGNSSGFWNTRPAGRRSAGTSSWEPAVEQDVTGVGVQQPGDHGQRRALPAAGRTEQRGERTGRERRWSRS